jgi:hypothetical protein
MVMQRILYNFTLGAARPNLPPLAPDLPPLPIEAGFRRAEKVDRAEQDQGNLLAAGMEAPAFAAVPRSKSRRTPAS